MIIELIITLISSFLFALGLTVSGMTDPKKVIGFLDITNNWDPSLIFVMIGAIIVNVIFFKIILKKTKPIHAKGFSLPTSNKIDKKLFIGAALFGTGWGLTGICPGPAIVNITSGQNIIFIYLAGMLLGMGIFETLKGRL